MGGTAKRRYAGRARAALAAGIAAMVLLAPAAEANILGRLSNFLVPGGYFFTSDGARQALNDSLWYRETDVFRYSIGVGLAGGAFSIKAINASSEITPFTGATQLTMFGPSVQVWTAKALGFRPYASAGVFAAQTKSRSLGTSDWTIVPSGSVGVQYSFTPVTTVTLEYRLNTTKVDGINTNGLAARLTLF